MTHPAVPLSYANALAQPYRASNWQLFRRMAKAYLKPQLRRLGVALIFMAVAAVMTGYMAYLMRPIIDGVFKAQRNDTHYSFWMIALVTIIVFSLRGIATYIHGVMVNLVGQRIVANIQTDMFRHLIRSDLAMLQSQSSGQLLSRMTNDVGVMRASVAECLTGFGKSTLTVVSLVYVMFKQDWRLASAAFVVFPIGGYFVRRLGKRSRRISQRTQAEVAHMTSSLTQVFQGARHVKAYCAEDMEERRMLGRIRTVTDLANKGFRAAALSTPVNEILSGLVIGSVIVYGGYQLQNNTDTAGRLISFITAFIMAFDPMKRLGKVNAQMQAGLAASERVFQLLDLPATIVDGPDARPLAAPKGGYDVEFDAVLFAYPDGARALDHIGFHAPAGKTVALVGASGAGKSTILNLIPRFYDVLAGTVRVAGQDVRKVTMDSLRSQIALVSQDTALFDDTIRANIAYGRQGATEAEIVAAATSAFAHDFISALPQGYDTPVGELGSKLSGGQRQRIAIARAMLKNAPILLLDEATSALDNESERAVQKALRSLQEGRTTIVVAHRLSTIVDADQIYVLEQGRIAECGTHGELLARGGAYSRLYGSYSGEEPAETGARTPPEAARADRENFLISA